MDLRETLSAQLPPTRPDEPARLRQDILDELNDHLVCAYNREILRGADRVVAERRVLEQFGDPAALARRLWLDEMKGRIMAQRVLIATCVLLTAASVSMAGLLWRQSIEARQLVARQAAASARLLADQNAIARIREQEVLKQLQDMSEAIRHPRLLDWNPVRIKLTEETPDGPPVAKASIAMNRKDENSPNVIQRVSDTSGVADFGLVQPGDYRYQIYRNSEDFSLQSYGELNVQPGSNVTKSVICPKPPVRVGVRVRCQWPADLEKESLCLYAPFRIRSREIGPGNQWTTHQSAAARVAPDKRNPNRTNMGVGQFQGLPLQHPVLFGPSTKIVEFLDYKAPVLWTLNNPAKQEKDPSKLGSAEWADFLEEDIRELKDPPATIEMATGRYGLSELLVLRPSAPILEPGQRRYELILAARGRNANRTICLLNDPINVDNVRKIGATMLMTPQLSMSTSRELPREYWHKMSNEFEARSGQPNEWTIPVADELAQAVRDALKAEKAPKAQPAEKAAAIEGNG